jgi:methylphosphotriester-DNA--protein-cysteine methyltransferase
MSYRGDKMSIDAQKNSRNANNNNEPQLVTGDQLVDELTRQLTQLKSQFKESENTTPIKSETESRLARIMEELTYETREQQKILQKNLEEMAQIREEIKRNQEEIGRIYRLVDAFDRSNEIGLGELKIIWGY